MRYNLIVIRIWIVMQIWNVFLVSMVKQIWILVYLEYRFLKLYIREL